MDEAADPGKRAKFEELAMPCLGMLFGMALRLSNDPSDAEDLVQDTYLKAYRAFDQFEEGTSFKAWIFKILNNTYLTKYKKDHSHPELLSVENTPEFYLYDKVVDLNLSVNQNPERVFLKKFIPDEIKKALNSLPDEYKMTFILMDVYEFSYDEISQIMDVSLGTVKSRLFRARHLLQQALC